MYDVEELAARARTTVATARMITLSISGLGPLTTDDPVSLLQADDGVPTFLCEPSSRVCPAAGNCAVLRAESGSGVAVAMLGRLERIGTRTVEGITMELVALRPDSVVVEEPGAPASRREIPVEAYLEADVDQLLSCAARILAHTNRVHGAQLRAAVARCVGASAGDIAAAELSHLDAHCATIDWIGTEGGDVLVLPFPGPARTAAQLGDRLRAQLH